MSVIACNLFILELAALLLFALFQNMFHFYPCKSYIEIDLGATYYLQFQDRAPRSVLEMYLKARLQ
jgi:hypothetical protein